MQVISMEERNVVVSKSSSDGGIYLTFAVSGREYGIELLKIRKIVGITTPVPTVQRFIKTNAFPSYFDPAGILSSIPHYVKGILRLHGKIIPIIDLGLRLGFQEAAYTFESCVIIVENYDKPAGIIVDKLLDVLDVCTEEIENMSSREEKHNDEVFAGMVTRNGRKRIILNIDKVLNTTSIAYRLKSFEHV